MCEKGKKILHVYPHCHHQPRFLIYLGEPVIGKQALTESSGGAELLETSTRLQNRVCAHMCLCKGHLLCNIILSLQIN